MAAEAAEEVVNVEVQECQRTILVSRFSECVEKTAENPRMAEASREEAEERLEAVCFEQQVSHHSS